MPDDLDREIDRLMAEAKALEWTHEGQIIHVRLGMERAYQAMRNAEKDMS